MISIIESKQFHGDGSRSSQIEAANYQFFQQLRKIIRITGDHGEKFRTVKTVNAFGLSHCMGTCELFDLCIL